MIEISASLTTPVEAFRSMGALLDAVGACIFSKDLLGRYTYVNRPMLALLGAQSVEAVLGREVGDYVDQQSADRIREHDLRVLHLGEEIEEEETNVFGATGEQRVFWTVKKPMHDAHGEVIGLCGVSTDITERKAIEAQLQEQRQLLLAVLNHIDAFVYMKDESRRYRFVNDKVAREWGIAAEEAVGKRDVEVMPLERADKFWELDQQVFAMGQPQIGEESFVGPDGRLVHHWSVKVPITYEGVPTLIGFSTDISEVVRLREQLREQAIRDALTGLFNRRHFNELAEKELARSRRHGHPTALVMLDIDHFKRINDTHGHPAGDTVLQRVAELLRAQMRLEDTPARVGGEEFALLLPRTDAAAASVLAERVRCAVREAEGLLPDGGRVTISLGVAVTQGEHKLEALYAAADAQLYRAKQSGRDRVCVV
ncbi:diguanylate cyclase (GGDEF)-like protein/PAS domain S-box-containing protein [Inhella inkyongensis]|uniref:diguanylate cyclase n=1 Tax=Inhella inkyongensis TaxID=392593 RepID=A0A840S0M2_9BURK|nr:GGDEF domain-containing protein [Inhella inkyongensis]MBB5203062.1 diguanylate cyclase (GGDEF)-like protein/PAS domain S-box-containing protein [Inhella inkyongensis]